MDLKKVKIKNGFWQRRKDLNINSSFHEILNSFEKSGRIRALTNENISSDKPHIFWESDLAKLMEGAFFSMQQEGNENLKSICDNIIKKIINNQEDNGYLNFFFKFHEPENKFTNLRDRHELYCAGHLLESAIEHSKATGENFFLNSIEKYIDHIIDTFGREYGKKRGYPGHQEIELALIKAYEYTNKKKYLKLATYFIEERGKSDTNHKHYFINENEILKKNSQKLDFSMLPSNLRDFIDFHSAKDESVFKDLEYWQAHKEPINQDTAEGHSVRALYMFTAMADLARINNNKDLLKTCKILWRNIVDKRMYIHGGVGSAHIGERFSFDYDLPNDMAFAETCASIALIYFANRLSKIEINSEYGDVIENNLYNLILASTSQDGKGFFYDNYLECNPGYLHFQDRRHGIRDEYHICSCCPPNIARLIASMDMYIYNTYQESLVVDQYISSEIDLLDKEQGLKIIQTSEFPYNGYSEINVLNSNNKETFIYFRIPSWDQKTKILINDEEINYETFNGYAKINRKWKAGDKIELKFDFTPRFVRTNPNVRYNIRKACIFRGPILYCLEEKDNGKNLNNIMIDSLNDIDEKNIKINSQNVTSLFTKGYKLKDTKKLYIEKKLSLVERNINFIPYYLWSNRGENEMLVWINEI